MLTAVLVDVIRRVFNSQTLERKMRHNIKEKEFLKLISENFIYIPIIPVVAGSGYIIGYISNIGRFGFQLISYADILSFSLMAIMSLSVSVSSLIILRLILRGIEMHFGHIGRNIVLLLLSISSMSIYLPILSNKILPSIGFDGISILVVNVLFTIPAIILVTWEVTRSIIIMVSILLFALIIIGHLNGRVELKSNINADYVCTDKCYEVDIFAILSNYVVTTTCEKKIVVFPSKDILRILTVNRKLYESREPESDANCQFSRVQ